MALRRITPVRLHLAALMLAGCGFHPRAELALPPDLGPVKVVASDPYSPLGDGLSRVRTRAGAKPAPKAMRASAVPAVAGCVDAKVATLRVVSEAWSELPLSVMRSHMCANT